MTREQIQRREARKKWNRLKARAANAPHGCQRARQKELKDFVKARLVEEMRA